MTYSSETCPAEIAAPEIPYAEIEVGMRASFDRPISERDIDRFVELTGDRNPLHIDDEYARTTEMGGRIAHGMLVGAFLSHLVGMHLPGKFALYLSQTLDFVGPVRAGDVLTISGEVVAKSAAVRTVMLRTQVRVVDGDVVARGRAIVKVLR